MSFSNIPHDDLMLWVFELLVFVALLTIVNYFLVFTRWRNSWKQELTEAEMMERLLKLRINQRLGHSNKKKQRVVESKEESETEVEVVG